MKKLPDVGDIVRVKKKYAYQLEKCHIGERGIKEITEIGVLVIQKSPPTGNGLVPYTVLTLTSPAYSWNINYKEDPLEFIVRKNGLGHSPVFIPYLQPFKTKKLKWTKFLNKLLI